MNADELKKQWKDARAYVNKVGEIEPHLQSVGKLHKLLVTTEVAYQDSPGAQNYWKDAIFDAALADVIKSCFPQLAHHALSLMQTKYEDALRAEKGALLARLAEIQAIEEQA